MKKCKTITVSHLLSKKAAKASTPKATKALDEFVEDRDVLKMDGYDDCVVGMVSRFGIDGILCYDMEKVIAKLMKNGIPSREEAIEFFSVNQIGAWMGDKTPCFITFMPGKS